MMIIETLKTLFSRDLQRLIKEIELYRDEKNIWQMDKNILNSAGNLCLHIVGNLNAYIGVGLAKTGYVRQRDLEFSLKDISREELIRKLTDTIQVVDAGLNNLNESQLEQEFPILIWDKPMGTAYTLLQLSTHLSYHLGQVNYHRRLIDSE